MVSSEQVAHIFSFHTFAYIEGLTEQRDIAMSCDLSEERDIARGDAQGFGGNDIVGWQFADPGPSAMLSRSQAAEMRLTVLGIDGLLQTLQLAAQDTDLAVMALEQAWLKPTVEVLDTAIVRAGSTTPRSRSAGRAAIPGRGNVPPDPNQPLPGRCRTEPARVSRASASTRPGSPK